MSDEKDLEQGFNESELQDIMSEIENLEEEFATDTIVENIDELKMDDCKANDMQSDIDKEVDAFMDNKEIEENDSIEEELDMTDSLIEDLDAELNGISDSDDDAMQSIDEEIEEVLSEVENVQVEEETQSVSEEIVENNITPIATTPQVKNESSQASGSFSMTFDIGGTPVKLDFDGGLVMSVAGVQVNINEESGCSVELPGGIKFSVPLDADQKKKAA